jgi:hypothetical protein
MSFILIRSNYHCRKHLLLLHKPQRRVMRKVVIREKTQLRKTLQNL